MAEARKPDWLDNGVCAWLDERGLLDHAAVDRVWRGRGAVREAFEITLNRAGVLSDQALLDAYAAMSGLTRADPADVPSEVVDTGELAPAFLQAKEALPLGWRGEALLLGVVNPLDAETTAGAAFAVGADVEPVLLSRSDWRRGFSRLYEPSGPNESAPGSAADDRLAALLEQSRDAPIARKVAGWLSDAVLRRASDIHIEPGENALHIRFRLDGQLLTVADEAIDIGESVLSRIKVLADLDLGERRAPQDGRVTVIIAGRPVDVRVSVVPSVFGESAVLRILDKSDLRLTFEGVGFAGEHLRWLTAAATAPNGLFLITGPTGSGKTTTLYAALEAMRGDARKILTIEDPVEYHFDHVVQCQVNEPAGLTFAAAIRAYLRQDPDVIVVGEIRDGETARAAVQAALTGHLVLATVHAIDATRVAPRLIEMGAEPYQLAACFRGALAQRLVRRLCPDCRRERSLTEADRARVPGLVGDTGFDAAGCPACLQTGYRGRLVLAEAFLADEAFAGAVRGGGEDMAADFTRMIDVGARLVAQGETSIEELLRAVSV